MLKLFDNKDASLDWEYDNDADTLYITFGKPKPVLGVDVARASLFDMTRKPGK